MAGAESVEMGPQAQEAHICWHHQKLEEAWGRFSLRASRKNQPCLGFELLASRIVKKLIAVVLNH